MGGTAQKEGRAEFLGWKIWYREAGGGWGFEPEKKRFSWESEPERLEPIAPEVLVLKAPR